MITVHSGWATDFSSLGLCSLTPVECTVEEHAGGMFQLKMTHPMDKGGKWWHLNIWNIIKAPAPMRETPLLNMSAAGSSVTRQIYSVNVSSRLRLRTKPSTSSGKIIGSYKSGAKVIKIGEEGSWYQVVVQNGGEKGWMYASYLKYVGEETQAPAQSDKPPQVVQPRQTRDQLFRIVSVEKDDTNGMVYVTALHVFYDLAGVTISGTYSPKDIAAAQAVQDIFAKAIKPHGFDVYTDAEGKITAEYTGRSIVSALTETDGILRSAGARLIRDNFDVFVLKDEERDKGVEIRHGKNMLGAVLTEDVTDVITTVIPVGKNKDGDPLYLDESIYVDADNAAELPVVRAKEISYDVKSGSDDFQDDEAARAELKRLAMLEFTENGINHPAVGLDVDFVQLENTRQYEKYAALQAVHLYDTVRVIAARAGISVKSRVTGYVYNCLTKKYDSMVLGELFELETSVSGYDIAEGSISGNRLVMGSVDGDKIRTATIQYAKIAQAAIEQLNAAAITAVIGRFGEIDAGSITTDELYAALAQIIELRFGQITGDTVDTDELYAELAEIILLRAKQIEAGSIETDELAAEYARIGGLLVDRIDAGNIQADVLGASLAKFVSMYAGTGEFDFATIQNLVAKAMSLTQGAMDTVYINNLAVTSANMLSATLGKLVIKGDDGNYYRVFVGSDGRISTEKVDDVTAEVQGGKQIVETNMNVGNLNATTIQGSSAVINSILTTALTADKITAADAMIASATIPALYATTIEAIGNSLQLLVRDSSRIFRSETPPSGAELGDLWVQPSTGFTYQFAGENVPDLYLNDPDLYYAHADDEGGYSLMMDAEGDLYADGEAAYTLGVSMDGHLTAWLRVKDGELDKAAKEALEKSNEAATLIVDQSADIKIMKDKIDSRVEVSVFDEVTGELETSVSSVNQRADSLEISMEKKVDGETLRTYIRYEDGVVEIGRSDSRYTTHTSDSGFVVKQDGVEMTSMVKNTVSAPVMEARRQFQIGRFSIRTGNDGGLLFL